MSDVSEYTIEYRVFSSVWWKESNQSRNDMKNVRDKLREKYGTEPPEGKIIKMWAEKLFQTGSVLDQPRSGRPASRENQVEVVKEVLEKNPITSIRQVSSSTSTSKSTVHRIMTEDLQLKCWQPVPVQFLTVSDHQLRVKCCEEILQKYSRKLFSNLLFTDECAVYLTPHHNQMLFWSKDNPHYTEQVQQYPPSVMIWAAIGEKHLIGPYFVEGKVTASNYLDLLRNEFFPELLRRGLKRSSHFQQDGAPAHTAKTVRDFLNEKFPDKWVGKFGPTAWPARSPDLTSCDNALWGLVKKYVQEERPNSIPEMKQAIRNSFTAISDEMLFNIHERTFRRLRLCIDLAGIQVDPYDH